MRSFIVFLFAALMWGASLLFLFAACQPGIRIGATIDGNWYELGSLVIAAAVVQIVLWSYVMLLGVIYPFCGKSLADDLQAKTERTLIRAADALKNVILDWDPAGESPENAEKPEFGTDPLPPLLPHEFVGSMGGRAEETLARVAEIINAAQTGQEVAGSEEQIKTALGELRFDAIALGLQMRNDAADAGLLIAGALPAARSAKSLSTKSGRAKSFAASEYWRPVWVERYRNMRAADTAFRLAERSRRRLVGDN